MISPRLVPSVGVQLDLARQKESLPFISSFIDLIADNGYDTLYLYLEGGIRVPSFAFAREDQSYSPEEIRSIVAYAAKKKIGVVPVFATLGHAEKFLAHPELAALSEQPEKGNEFCPSREETYHFLCTFLREAVPLFETDVIHVGCDEVFHLASCPCCQKRLAAGETRADIFAAHLARIHEFVTGELGKRMMIWDDMADFLPDILPRIPKDVELVFWEYDFCVHGKQTKFGNRKRCDIFKKYANRVSYHAAPRELRLDNVMTMIHYAKQYAPAGFYLTTWEHACDFMYAYEPLIAFAGRFWHTPEADVETLFGEVCRDLFQSDSQEFASAVFAVFHLDEPLWAPLQSLESGGYKRHPNDATMPSLATVRLIAQVLESQKNTVCSERGKIILADLLMLLKERLLMLKTALWQTGRLNGVWGDSGGTLLTEWTRLRQDRNQAWETFRPGLPHSELDLRFERIAAGICKTVERAVAMKSMLRIRFFLPDFYGCETVKVAVREEGNTAFQLVYHGVPKPDNMGEHPYYELEIPLTLHAVAEVRLTASGRNGIGVCCCSVDDRCASGVVVESGIATTPEAVLVDDTTWAMLGDQDGIGHFFDAPLAEAEHTLSIRF